jgi:PiT family inorganic phosphate transporter
VELTLVAVVAVALFFDFTNGFHDTANAIATSVSTRAISPRLAVLGAAILNFLGAGLVGAIAWDLITWFYGLPTSSSHALIGGVAGAAVAAAGWDVLLVDGLVEKVLIPSIAAPLLGFAGTFLLMLVILWMIRRRSPSKVNRVFRRVQLVSASFVAFTHGTNDAQKTMGIIALALIASGHMSSEEFDVPLWVIVSSATAMGLGTYVGGWRIIRTLGTRVAKLEPPQGFAAETTTASLLWITGNVGFPVSTTHTISGSVLGAGASRRFSAVRWGVAGNIVLAWVLTVPAAALIGATMEVITRMPGGTAIVFLLVAAIAAAAFMARRWQTRRLAFPPTVPSPARA